jgi:nicotinate-nucleotide adenylyltransferase
MEDIAAVLPIGLSIHTESTAPGEVEMRTFTLSNEAGATTPFYLLPGLEVEISASDIRRQVSAASGRLCAGPDLLPDAVCDYIAAHGLYR